MFWDFILQHKKKLSKRSIFACVWFFFYSEVVTVFEILREKPSIPLSYNCKIPNSNLFAKTSTEMLSLFRIVYLVLEIVF